MTLPPEPEAWVCDHCGWEFWKPGLGSKPDGWLCLACRFLKAEGKSKPKDGVEKLLEQVWPD